jgi:hypothetical protein
MALNDDSPGSQADEGLDEELNEVFHVEGEAVDDGPGDIAERMSRRSGIPLEYCNTLLHPDNEYELVRVIRIFLRTMTQKLILDNMGLTIEDCLHHRCAPDQEWTVVAIFSAWNEKLGWKCFL